VQEFLRKISANEGSIRIFSKDFILSDSLLRQKVAVNILGSLFGLSKSKDTNEQLFSLLIEKYNALLSTKIIERVEYSIENLEQEFQRIVFYDIQVVAKSANNLAEKDKHVIEIAGEESKGEEEKEEVKQAALQTTMSLAALRASQIAGGKKKPQQQQAKTAKAQVQEAPEEVEETREERREKDERAIRKFFEESLAKSVRYISLTLEALINTCEHSDMLEICLTHFTHPLINLLRHKSTINLTLVSLRRLFMTSAKSPVRKIKESIVDVLFLIA
jgi:hypothetical protein